MTISEFGMLMSEHSPCKEGMDQFMACESRKDIFNLMTSPLGYDFLLRSREEGWGPKNLDIVHSFRSYINGRYTSVCPLGEDRKTKVQLWCGYRDVPVDDEVRWIILLGCTGTIRVGHFQVVKLIVDVDTDVYVECPDDAVVYIENYGGSVFDVYQNCKILKK